jgi:glycosyltransferase involved in cell wall biosynthesis
VVSRLEPEKNIALAIKTFGTIVAKFPKAGLIIVGAGSEKSRLESLVKRLGLVKQIVFTGQQDNLTAYYQSADVLLNTSNYEGYGLVLAEARLTDLSVVSTDVGIARELVGAESVCPVGDEKCLAQKVEWVLLGQVKQPPVPDNLVETNFNRYVEKYVNLLKQCLER